MLKLLKYLKAYSFQVIAILVLLFVQSLSNLYLPNLMSKIVDKGIISGNINEIYKYGWQMILITIIGVIAMIIAYYLIAIVGDAFARDLREKVFLKVESFSQGDIDKFGTSSLINRTTNDITQVQRVTIMIFKMMITAPLVCIGGIIMAVHSNAKLSLVLVIAIPILLLAITIIGRKGVPLFKVMQSKLDRLNLIMRENLTGVRVIRAFNKEDYEKKKFKDGNDDLTNISIRVNQVMAALRPSMMLIMNITSIVIVWIGAKFINSNNLQIGDLMAFIQYAMQIMFSLLMLAMMFVLVPRAAASAARLNEVLTTEPSINDEKELETIEENKKGYIEFKNVTFAYEGAEEPVLSNISFITKPGETTAIIGGTGSGKSTLISLIPRFYDITEGEILIDDVNIRKMSQHDLRSKIGFVPQKAILFSGTIADNIKYGKEDATMEEIEHAAKIAQSTEFISNMEDGYNHLIEQGGNNVSGGQKQRLSIARALIKKPEVYVFDDSFSALDFKTDAKLREALKEETKESAVIIVGQRISSVRDSDRIIVLDEGKIEGIGTHKELLENCPLYKEIALSQLSKEEIENEFKK
ncbi:MAG: ABC transporter ATP-binding protein [Sarcina sp.]